MKQLDSRCYPRRCRHWIVVFSALILITHVATFGSVNTYLLLHALIKNCALMGLNKKPITFKETSYIV